MEVPASTPWINSVWQASQTLLSMLTRDSVIHVPDSVINAYAWFMLNNVYIYLLLMDLVITWLYLLLLHVSFWLSVVAIDRG